MNSSFCWFAGMLAFAVPAQAWAKTRPTWSPCASKTTLPSPAGRVTVRWLGRSSIVVSKFGSASGVIRPSPVAVIVETASPWLSKSTTLEPSAPGRMANVMCAGRLEMAPLNVTPPTFPATVNGCDREVCRSPTTGLP